MKLSLLLSTLFFSSASFAFTEKDVFSCLNKEAISVQSSLMPDGSRYLRAFSSDQPENILKSVSCEDVASEWSAFGSENCFANEDMLFSHFGTLGILKMKKDGLVHFTLCEKTDSFQ